MINLLVQRHPPTNIQNQDWNPDGLSAEPSTILHACIPCFCAFPHSESSDQLIPPLRSTLTKTIEAEIENDQGHYTKGN